MSKKRHRNKSGITQRIETFMEWLKWFKTKHNDRTF